MYDYLIVGSGLFGSVFAHEMHKKRFNELVALRDKLDLPIATMLDTKGPEIRIGYFKDHKAVTLKEGDDYILTSRDIECDEKQASVSFKELAAGCQNGHDYQN